MAPCQWDVPRQCQKLRGPGGCRDSAEVGRQRGIRLTQVEAHRVFIQDVNRLDTVKRPMVELSADGRVFDAQDIQLHGLGIDLRPLWNSTPWRSRNTHEVSPWLGSQLSAMPGTMLPC